MVVAGTVGVGDSMVADFLAMLGLLRRAGSRMRVVMVAGIELIMAAEVERMRRDMGCRDGRSVAGWEYRMRGRGFITAVWIGGVGMGFRMGMVWAMTGWIMAGSMQTIRIMGMRIIPGMDTMARTMWGRMMTARA
jgi:hypothetical protein